MEAHPDFAEMFLPREADIGAFRLAPLSPDHVDEDFIAVTESAGVLGGLFGDDWPKGLTLDDNLADLERHDREFLARQAFSWIVRTPQGDYLGCAYLYPAVGVRGEGRVFTWIRARPDRLETLGRFNAALRAWLVARLPESYALSWTSNDWPEP